MLARDSKDNKASRPLLLHRTINQATQHQRSLRRFLHSHPFLSLASILTLLSLALLAYYHRHTTPLAYQPNHTNAALDTLYPPTSYERPLSTFVHPLTITTAYYPFQSKHSSSDYTQWLSNFLAANPTPIVAYTTAGFYPHMAAIRYRDLFVDCNATRFTSETVNALHRVACPLQAGRSLADFPTHFNVSFSSPLGLPITALYSQYWASQLVIDPERKKHTPTLYATWAAKAWLVNQTATANPFHSKYFAWMDAGQFRNPHKPWQSPVDTHKLAAVFGENEADGEALPDHPPFPLYNASRHSHPSAQPVSSRLHKLLINLVNPLPPSYCTPTPIDPLRTFPPTLLSDHAAGQSFLGTAPAIHWYTTAYYALLLSYQQRALLWGKDQNVANGVLWGYRGSVVMLGGWRLAGLQGCVVGRGWDAHWSWIGEWLQVRGGRRTVGEVGDVACPEAMYGVEGMVVEAQAVCDGTHGEWLQQSEEEASKLQGPPAKVAKAEAEQTQRKHESGM